MNYASLEEALTVGYGVERAFVCPVGHSANAHASVNSITGWWYCFSCGAKGHVDLDRLELDPRAVVRQIEHMLAPLNRVHETYPETFLNLYDALGPGEYWKSRFGETIIAHHRLGQAYDGTCATIPMRDNSGNVLGVIRRDLTGNDEVKYRYPSGIKVSNFLYHYHCARQEILVLTEGATDSIAGEEVTTDLSFMACYGDGLSREQARLIRKYNPAKVLVAFDQDSAGHRGFYRVRERLAGFFPVERLQWRGYKDLASMPVAERTELLHKVTGRKHRIKVVKS